MDKTSCFCHQSKPYEHCCQPYHLGLIKPATTLDLLRSRYSAYACCLADYIEKTMIHPALATFNRSEIEQSNTQWLDLTVLAIESGGTLDHEGSILFEATFKNPSQSNKQKLVEHSLFVRHDGAWVYQDCLY